MESDTGGVENIVESNPISQPNSHPGDKPVNTGFFENIQSNSQQKLDRDNSKQSQNSADKRDLEKPYEKLTQVFVKSERLSTDKITKTPQLHSQSQTQETKSNAAECVPNMPKSVLNSPPLFETESDNESIQIDNKSLNIPNKATAVDIFISHGLSTPFNIQLNTEHMESLYSSISSNFMDDNRSDGVISTNEYFQTTHDFQDVSPFEMDQFINSVYRKSVDEIIFLQNTLASCVDNLFMENKSIT